jgi:hypothetical protein
LEVPYQGKAFEEDHRVDSWAQDSLLVEVVVVMVPGGEEVDVRKGDEVRVVWVAPKAGQADAYRDQDHQFDA